MSSHQIRVFDRIDRARSARSELISSGRRPQDVRILDAQADALTRNLEGPPIPETIAGMLVGAIFTTVLAVIPQIGPIFDRGGPMSYALIAIGALIGACVAYSMIYFMNAVDFPINVANRPPHSPPTHIPTHFSPHAGPTKP